MASPKGGVTGCVALSNRQPAEPGPLGPLTCGWPAKGPHPDPEKSYREPLCDVHLAEAVSVYSGGPDAEATR